MWQSCSAYSIVTEFVVALSLIRNAEETGVLKPGGIICEGTGGNTGIGLAMVAAARGYRCLFTMPVSTAQEKVDCMRNYGAEVILTPPAPFSDPNHYFHVAAREAKVSPSCASVAAVPNQCRPVVDFLQTSLRTYDTRAD